MKHVFFVILFFQTLFISFSQNFVPNLVHDNMKNSSLIAVFQFEYQNKLIVRLNDTVAGTELWEIDGDNKRLIKDINEGKESSSPMGFIEYDGILYFWADDGIHGAELWSYDGNATLLVKDINPGTRGSHHGHLESIIFNGELYFSANRDDVGIEFWKYDGTEISLVKDINKGSLNSGIYGLTVYQNELYFSALGSLRRFDGLRVLSVSSTKNYPRDFFIYKEELYFSSSNREQLLKLSANNVEQVISLNNDYQLSELSEFYVHDNLVYFNALQEGQEFSELWTYNGDTVLVVQEYSHRFPRNLITYNNELYFSALDYRGNKGSELWKLGSGGPELIFDINPTNGASGYTAFDMFVYNDNLFFRGNDGVNGQELWVHNADTTKMVADINSLGNGVGTSSLDVFEARGHLYFWAFNGESRVLYKLGEELLFSETNEKPNQAHVLYPNPASDYIHLSYELSEKVMTGIVYVFNELGVEEDHFLLENKNTYINTSRYKSGVYTYRIISGKETLLDGKFVIIK